MASDLLVSSECDSVCLQAHNILNRSTCLQNVRHIRLEVLKKPRTPHIQFTSEYPKHALYLNYLLNSLETDIFTLVSIASALFLTREL
jgi:hypothetical protein